MVEFSENRHISNLINMSCKVTCFVRWKISEVFKLVGETVEAASSATITVQSLWLFVL